MRLEGKIALVTASTGGIGEIIAARLASEGAEVVVSGRTEEKGEQVVVSLREDGSAARFIRCDVGDESSVRSLVDAVEERCGALHVLVNNAAPTDARGPDADRPLHELPLEVFTRLLNTGLLSMVHTCKYAIPLMRRSGGGSIINVSSTASVTGVAGMPAYSASKGAMNALTRQLAVDYGPDIRVNALIVGSIDAKNERSRRKREDPMIRAAQERLHSTRLGEREDVAAAAAFLASDADAGFITGSLLHVDGGSLAKMAVPNLAAVAYGEDEPSE